jgi:heme oxygenase
MMAELKQRIAPYHQALEMDANIWASLTSRAAYRNLLSRFFGFIAALEGSLVVIDDLQIWLPDVSERWKTPLLIKDLELSGISSEQCPICTIIPDIRSVGTAFGCLYVLEGSTLGGQIIARQVYKHLGLTPENGCQFFSSYGATVGPMWKNFGEHLETWCAANEVCRGEIVRSAAETFACFSRWLASNGLAGMDADA